MSITYPVDVENTWWALYDTDTLTVVKERARWPRHDGEAMEGLSPNLVPLLMVYAAAPAYDAATQKLDPPTWTVDVANNTYTRTWSIVALSQAELDDIAERDSHNSVEGQAKSAYTALKNGTGTNEERIQRIENILSWFLKDRFYGEL